MKISHLFIAVFILFLTGCKEQELLKGLDQRQANEVLALLQKNNIYADKKDFAKDGYKVSVAKQDFSNAVELLRIYNLPSQPRMEIARMFPSDSLISSPLAEMARLYSAIEQRLEQSLMALQGVTAVQVHVSYQFDSSNNVKKKEPEHVSALISYDNHADSSLMISDVKRFLKNSFTNLSYDDISVVLNPSAVLPITPELAFKNDAQQFNYWWLSIPALLILMTVSYLFYRKFDFKKVLNG